MGVDIEENILIDNEDGNTPAKAAEGQISLALLARGYLIWICLIAFSMFVMSFTPAPPHQPYTVGNWGPIVPDPWPAVRAAEKAAALAKAAKETKAHMPPPVFKPKNIVHVTKSQTTKIKPTNSAPIPKDRIRRQVQKPAPQKVSFKPVKTAHRK